MPTPAELERARTNLARMQDLIRYVHNNSGGYVNHAYLLLDQVRQRDPGLAFGVTVIAFGLGKLGGQFGPAGQLVASFLSGMITDWLTHTPESLKTAFAEVWLRFEKTYLEADLHLARYRGDPQTYWDVEYKGPGFDTPVKVSAFATCDLPESHEEAFVEAAGASVRAFDQQLWREMVSASFRIFSCAEGPWLMRGRPKSNPPMDWAHAYIKKNPFYDVSWKWVDEGYCCEPYRGWEITGHWIGRAARNEMTGECCHYLFRDDGHGKVTNPDGLFARKEVFHSWRLAQSETNCRSSRPAARISRQTQRAFAAGHTIQHLIAAEGRAAVEARILQRAADDPSFAFDLHQRPREALEALLGVKIPEVVGLQVIFEAPDSFALVVPSPLSEPPRDAAALGPVQEEDENKSE